MTMMFNADYDDFVFIIFFSFLTKILASQIFGP